MDSPFSHGARRAANVRGLKLAARRSGLRIDEYLASVGMTRDEFLDGKRPANYGSEKHPSSALQRTDNVFLVTCRCGQRRPRGERCKWCGAKEGVK